MKQPPLLYSPGSLLPPCSGDVTPLAAAGLKAESRGKARADPKKEQWGQRGGVKILLCILYMPAWGISVELSAKAEV